MSTNYKNEAIFVIIFISYVILGTYFETRLDRIAINWPHTFAEIISHEECSNPYDCGISYHYKIKGEEIIGNRVMFSAYHMPKGWSTAEKQEWIVHKFPINKQVKVFYNNENPKQSALLVGVSIESLNESISFFSKVCIFWIFILLIWSFVIKKHNKKLKKDGVQPPFN